MHRLRSLFHDSDFRRGALDFAEFTPGLFAWALVTGVAMVKSGLGVGAAVAMSLFVYAGSAQLAALPMMAAGAPMPVIWAAALCVNLRFLIYSAQWRVYIAGARRWQRVALGFFAGDVLMVVFKRRYPADEAVPGQVRYLIGGEALGWVMWQIGSVLGIVLADSIPTHWGLGFAGTLGVLGLTYGLLTDRVTWLAAFVAGGAAVAAYALPLKLNILVAIAAAVTVALLMEQAAGPRKAASAGLR